jgi:phage baseplate assembly protein W
MTTLYSGYSTLDFKSGTITQGQYPSSHIGTENGVLVPNIPPFKVTYQLEYPGNNTFKVTDIPLVERNLLNHIFTKKGSRKMMPTFGTIIPTLLFETMTDVVIEQVKSDLTAVVAYDPRVKLKKMSVIPNYDTSTLTCSMDLYYIELNVTKNMEFHLEFNL